MNSQTEETAGGPGALDSVLLVAAVALLVGGMFAFYYFTPQFNVLIRTLMVLGSVIAAVGLSSQTVQGKLIWGYVLGARVELRKVVWPTRQESIQTTLMIAVVVLIMALFLAGVDWVLAKGVHELVGAKS